jgi:hypothetical protein
MELSLSQMTDRLRRIFRGEERYGEGAPADQARRYRLEVVLPATVDRVVANSSDVPREPVDLLVSLSGFSPETTILAFKLLKPQRLMIVSSREARASIDVIQQVLNLPLSRLYPEDCNPTDPMGIYQSVQKAAALASNGEGPARVIIDITGGKKVMSASAALAAAQLDLPLCYVNGDFDPEMRQSLPGTERLVIVPNPTALFGDRQLDAALAALRHGAYAAAHAGFAEVAEVAYEPARARVLRDLSAVYQAWCDLDFKRLAGHATVMRARLADAGYRLPGSLAGRLREQLRFVDSLVEGEGPPSMLNFYLLGLHYKSLGRHDFAALLFYRTIETVFAQRLGRIAPGFRGKGAKYDLFDIALAELTGRYASIASVIYRRDISALPYDVGLMDGALLLAALSDPIATELGLSDLKFLNYLKTTVDARNDSVLAHGMRTVEPDYCRKLENLALRCLRAFWKLEQGAEKLDERIATLKFVVEV